LNVADEEHVRILKQGFEVWNAWRDANPALQPDLAHADLRGTDPALLLPDLAHADLIDANPALLLPNLAHANLIDANLNGADLTHAHLHGADLTHANLQGADLIEADLQGADLIEADLNGADLTHARLHSADLTHANLHGANLTHATLIGANLRAANLRAANLTHAWLSETFFVDVDLSSAIGLDTCIHLGPSTIDHRTLQKSGSLPLAFLRSVGLPDILIDYLPSLLNQAIQHYSCFISYSTQDQEFADRLYADLQNKGVRCWFAPHDLQIGKKILDAVDAAIRLRDRVLLILSEHSINSDWVEDEVTAGFEEERKRGEEVLFPIRLDDAVLNTKEAWAAKLRARLIGDFRQWKDHDVYQQSFQRMMRDLTKEQSAVPRPSP
jgi:hypothetical protein